MAAEGKEVKAKSSSKAGSKTRPKAGSSTEAKTGSGTESTTGFSTADQAAAAENPEVKKSRPDAAALARTAADTAQQLLKKKKKERRRLYTDEMTLNMIDQMQESGRKGIKLPRINMSFQPETYLYISTMSKVMGQSMTEFVNTVLLESLTRNREAFEAIVAFKQNLEPEENK